MARAIRALARRSPGRYQAVQGAAWVHDPDAHAVREASIRVVDEIADAVTALGVPDDRRIDAVRAVRAAVHGFVVLELDGGFGMPDDVDASFDFLVAGLVGGLERLAVSSSALLALVQRRGRSQAPARWMPDARRRTRTRRREARWPADGQQ